MVLIGAGFVFRNFRKTLDGQLSEPISRGSIVNSVYGIGTVVANQRFDLKLGTISTIDEIYVAEGDWVKKGQGMIKLDRVVFKAPFSGTIT